MDPARLRRIHLLGKRFHELQGLRIALTGASLSSVVGAYALLWPEPTNYGTLAAVAVSVVPTALGMPGLNRYYAANFGRKVPASQPRSWLPFVLFVAVYNMVGFWLNARFPEIPTGAPTIWTITLLSVFVAVRDWRWRSYYLLAPLATGIAFIASASVSGALEPGLTLAVMFPALGASMVAIGLLDHLTLVRLVREARETSLSTSYSSDRPPHSHT